MAGIPVPTQSWKLGPYLDYWLENVVKPTRRPATVALYEINIRVHLKPGLGKHELRRLSVATVQAFFNGKIRRGEVLGLRWSDIDADTIHVRQQVQRIKGELHIGPVKTRAGSRDLPLLGLAAHALADRRAAQQRDRARLGTAWTDTGLIFTAKTGRPVEPRNLVRSFARICDDNGIRVHALRHTTASLLKKLAVPPKDAQVILGHAHISTTQQIYTHVDEAAKRDAITRLNKLLGGGE